MKIVVRKGKMGVGKGREIKTWLALALMRGRLTAWVHGWMSPLKRDEVVGERRERSRCWETKKKIKIKNKIKGWQEKKGGLLKTKSKKA